MKESDSVIGQPIADPWVKFVKQAVKQMKDQDYIVERVEYSPNQIILVLSPVAQVKERQKRWFR